MVHGSPGHCRRYISLSRFSSFNARFVLFRVGCAVFVGMGCSLRCHSLQQTTTGEVQKGDNRQGEEVDDDR